MSLFEEKKPITFATWIYCFSVIGLYSFIGFGYYNFTKTWFFVEHHLRGAILSFIIWLFVPGMFSIIWFGLRRGEERIIESVRNYRLLFGGAAVMGLINYLSWPALPKDPGVSNFWWWVTIIVGGLHILLMKQPACEDADREESDVREEQKRNAEDAERYRERFQVIESDS